MSYDFNGLPLSPVTDSANSNNAYLYAHMDWNNHKYVAKTPIILNNVTRTPHAFLGSYDDARDAAFVAMTFAETYSKDAATAMYMDGTFRDVVDEFLANLEIPEWKYPSEQITFAEFENAKEEGYTTNRVEGAREAILEILKIKNLKAPNLTEAKALIAKVEAMVKAGTHNYRQAAKVAFGV
jgi:hypothetical protein